MPHSGFNFGLGKTKIGAQRRDDPTFRSGDCRYSAHLPQNGTTGLFGLQSPDDIDLMDLAITAAESWKLLLIGPAVAAMIVFGVSRFLPQQYELTLLIPLSVNANQALATAGGVGAVLGFRASGDEGIDIQAEPGAFRISARNALTGNVTVSAHSSDSSRTQKLLSIFSARLIALITAQKEAAGNEIQIRLKAYSRQNELLERIIFSSVGETAPGKLERAMTTAALPLTNQIRDNQIAIGELERELTEVRSPVTSSVAPQGLPISRDITFSVLATLSLSTIALLIFVFAREAARKASASPEFSPKMVRLKRAFGLISRQQSRSVANRT